MVHEEFSPFINFFSDCRKVSVTERGGRLGLVGVQFVAGLFVCRPFSRKAFLIPRTVIGFRDRMVGLQVFLLVCMFGSSTWLTINAIWVELSLYTGILPEGCVLHKCARLNIKKPPLILCLLLFSTISMLLLALFWESTFFVFGAQRSVAIILLTFLMALVSSTSNVLFLPFMAVFHPNYLTAYFVGMSLSSLVPSVLKLVQGVGNYECLPIVSPNGTSTVTAVQTEPLFHVRLYNLTMGEKCPELNGLVGETAEDEWKEQSPLKPVVIVGKCFDQTSPNLPSLAGEKDKLRFWTLIVCLSLICAEMNTIIPSVHSYATLAYSLLTYHWALTLSNLSHPLANFLPLWLKPHSLPVLLGLTAICTVGTAFIFVLALQSPNPIFRDSAPEIGSAFVIVLSIVTGFLCSYLRTHITGLIRGEHPDSESRLFWCGFFMQVGSFLGACVMFPLVNVFKVFQKRDPCT
uniref:Riboflavin transporter n=1 Tax=Globodera rostochiensis TaxID=31243 RepID=A0A914HCP5_GLORO